MQAHVLDETLSSALDVLAKLPRSHLVIRRTARALERVRGAINRPCRIALLGESNSGKSTVANFIIGEVALPALPIANTRLPTLLRYSTEPFVHALTVSGDRHALSGLGAVVPSGILRLEVGLPSAILRKIELIDFPGGANPLFHTDLHAVLRHRFDCAIWTTVATQAWRETERIAWLGMPPRIRGNGLLAVTHCDLLTSTADLGKVQTRLTPVAHAHFKTLCFLALARRNTAAARSTLVEEGSAGVFDWIDRTAQDFRTKRAERAAGLTRRLAGLALQAMDLE